MTGEDGSYEFKYNKIENLLGELTRLMDNVENTLLPQNNTNVIIKKCFEYKNKFN